jgi:ABC-type multidrug transport system ATPase subunit
MIALMDGEAGDAGLIVETHGLSKRYGRDVLAVDRLDLRLRRGEVFGFLGPNGAGKTTTLRMLTGLIRPTSGSAVVAGHPPGDPAGLARIGALIESPAFYPYVSGRDNLKVLARYAGVPATRVESVLAEVEMQGRAKDRVSTYSMGMRQRLGVAAALLKSPELLILDEPANGLDPQGMVEMRSLLRRLGEGDRTVLVSSHLLGEVEQVCDRVGVIQSGRLIAQGTLDELRGGAGLVKLRAEPSGQALQVLEKMLGPGAARRNGDGVIEVTIPAERIAEMTRTLVAGGLDVTDLRREERSLEEAFLTLTGGVGGL